MIPNIPEKPLVASANQKVDPAMRVYFFENADGTKFHVDAQAAWTLFARGNQTLGEGRVKPRYLGTSDGTEYAKAVTASHTVLKEQGLEAAQQFLRDAWVAEMERAQADKTPPPNFDTTDKFGRAVNMALL